MKDKPPGSVPPSDPDSADEDETALRLRLREALAAIAKTGEDLDDFCLTYLPEVSKRFTEGMDLQAKQNLIRKLVSPAELAQVLTERTSEQLRRLTSGFLRPDPLLARVMSACRYKEQNHNKGLRIEPVFIESGLRFAIVSYEVEGIETRYALGATDRTVTKALLKRFMRAVQAHYLDTASSQMPRLIYQYARGTVLADEVKQAARNFKPPIILRSLSEYENLIDLKDAVSKQTQRLASNPHYPAALYVPQRMDVSPGVGLRFDPNRAPETHALDTVIGWLRQEGGRFILVLGDFGAGKTFLLREAARRLGQQRSSVTPLICELRQIEKSQDLDTLLVQHMQLEQITPIDPKALRHMCRMGKVVLLFDGFDELALRTDYHRAAQHLETLIAAVEDDAKVLVTSRTQHFLNDAQVTTVLAKRLERVHTLVGRLRPFEPDQVLQFLKNQLGDPGKAQARFELIDEVKDLLGLSKNPRMLSFIAQIDPERLRGIGQIGAAQLYEVLINQWIDGEIKRKTEGVAGPMLTAAQINQALDRLALVLWRKAEPTASLEELEQATAGVLSQLDLEVGVAAQQLGSSSLLCRDAQSRFSFYHHSLLEWFIARWLVDEIKTGKSALLTEKVISRLMAEFIRGFLGDAEASKWVRKILGAHNQNDPGPLVQSALVLAERMKLSLSLSLEGQDLRGQDLSQLNLREANLRGADLREQSLQKQDLRKADLSRANLTDANLQKADLRGADLRGANLNRANLLGADLRGAQTEGATLRRAKLLGAKTDDSFPGADSTGAGWQEFPRIEYQPRLWAPGPSSVAWQPCGDLIALVMGSELIGIHDARSGACVRVLEGHTGPVFQVAFSPGNGHLASASNDETVRIWGLSSGDCIHTLAGHHGGVRTVAFSPSGGILASGSQDAMVRIWDYYEGKCKHALIGHRRPVTCLSFSPDGHTLATGSEDGTIRIWDPALGELKNIFRPQVGEILCLAFSPDGRTLAIGGKDSIVWLLDRIGANLQRSLKTERGPIRSLSWSPEGRTLATCSGDVALQWDMVHPRPRTLFNGDKTVHCAVFSPDGSRLASVKKEGIALIWDYPRGECLFGLDEWVPAIMGGMFLSDGRSMDVIGEDGTVSKWAPDGYSRNIENARRWDLSAVTRSTNRRELVICDSLGEVYIWDPVRAEHRQALLDRRFLYAALSTDGRTLAGATVDRSVELWDIEQRLMLRTLIGHKGVIRSLAFSPDGSILASASEDQTIRLWGSVRGEGRYTLWGHSQAVCSAVFSPDGDVLASASEDRTVRIWDLERGDSLRTLCGHRDIVSAVVFSPQGDILASASRDRSVKLWRRDAEDCFRTLTGHREAVTSLWFSPNGKLLASGSADQTVRLWAVETGRCLRVLLIGKKGWCAIDPETGRYQRSDDLDGFVWFTSGLCRFELTELEELFPDLRITGNSPILPVPAIPA